MNKSILLSRFFSVNRNSYFWEIFGEETDLIVVIENLKLNIERFLRKNGTQKLGRVYKLAHVEENVFLGNNSLVEPFAYIKGPTVIGDNVLIRKGAYIREFSFIDHDCIIGNYVEIKESVIMSNAQVPHLSYVGNSIIGSGVLLGAGFRASNEKLINSKGIKIFFSPNDFLQTSYSKMGCIIGDKTRIGCNVVVCPGSVIGKDSIIYPNIVVRGYIPEGTILKLHQELSLEKIF